MLCSVCKQAFPSGAKVPNHRDTFTVGGVCPGSGHPPWTEPKTERKTTVSDHAQSGDTDDRPARKPAPALACATPPAPAKDRKKAKRALDPEVKAMHLVGRATAGLSPAAKLRVAQWFLGKANEVPPPQQPEQKDGTLFPG